MIAVVYENDFELKEETADRKKEVIDLCLSKLVSKGLTETSVRDLSASLKLKKAGIYYYFKDKDDAIVACAEEAANRLETNLILPALHELHDPDSMLKRLYDRANEMAPTMRYFAQVCATPKYREEMNPVLSRLSNRYKVYATRVADKLGIKAEEFEPYFYMSITAVSNFMIFNDESFLIPQMKLVRKMIEDNKRNELL